MDSSSRFGALSAALAFLLWGFAPLYWKCVDHVAPLELLAHRIVWALPLLALYVRARGNWPALGEAWRHKRTRRLLVVSTFIIGCNWFLFVWAILTDRVLETSLGYFINPLVSVFLGYLFLKERLSVRQRWAVGLAATGVIVLAVAGGAVPFLALALALTFAIYGLLRKKMRCEASVALTIEVALMGPVATLFLVANAGGEFATSEFPMPLWIACAGPVTALPLLLFGFGARRIRLATLGFLQYLAPTGHFLLAVLVFAEPFTRVHMATFGLIWLAVGLFAFDAWRAVRREGSFPLGSPL
ncbi:MAG: EamA family transporter RarD [Planctomycetota bacterium]